jgi:RNA polymerase sigma-70 factor (ECF subfamily)
MGRAQDGDRDAYRALLDDVSPLLLAFLRRRVVDPHEVEDIHQETLIAMHRARHTYDPSRPLEPWLFTIARNVATDHNRRHLARLSWEVLLETPPEGTTEPADGRLAEALQRLPPAQREAFELLKIEGLSVAAGAARAGTSEGALRVRAHRAYKAIKAFLRGEP